MTGQVERYHWLNTIVGVLDVAFHLGDTEQFHVIDIVNTLLSRLHIPERGAPVVLPAPLSAEISAGVYGRLLSLSPADRVRPVRPVEAGDCQVSVESWRMALLSMLLDAHPDLTPLEQVAAAKVFTDLLLAIGVPSRVAFHLPEEVIASHLSAGDLTT